ncbi:MULTISPECIES: hypothetical protein [unclassified Mesorhizobium]|uniref:hypothetical protein n=1 Tax=unclassified Mesorhizobium TaxID=325217 RepID=UPI0003CEBAC2|nr:MULTISPECIES: hypothetical protein [unclassified Mesorhizobium]ESY51392.1 hypothetical protein X745_23290 [Mesorhizobium sp. LNJC374B00]ESY56853.1 hypothetical protein X744_21695 [Mesorhizobium sp. LNJC372A00]WJI82112.1 hypothetical protein NLY34_04965 [Mesorhizobium sp. C374B]WJI88631.1 hypothetical protein NLY42_07375 [Mesorhizobium sp. C372A]
MKLKIGKITLPGPVLIPSISIFETQGKLTDALTLQDALSEPITLLSAHDIAIQPELMPQISRFRERGGAVFIDSGGYEASRIGRYVKAYREGWTIDHYKSVIDVCEHDLAASFDLFIKEGETPQDFQLRLCDFLAYEHEFIEKGKIVPVVHLHNFLGAPSLTDDEAVDLVDRIAAEIDPSFIAIPERELGDGLAAKRDLTKKITSKLAQKERKAGLHVLGCGNPLSFAILAEAGIAMADGLEWCRILVGPNFHLHHFQHGGLFPAPEFDVYNPTADVIRDTSQHYLTLTLARNLHALQGFVKQVIDALEGDDLSNFLERNFGEQAARVIR